MGSIHGKNRGGKSRDTASLKSKSTASWECAGYNTPNGNTLNIKRIKGHTQKSNPLITLDWILRTTVPLITLDWILRTTVPLLTWDWILRTTVPLIRLDWILCTTVPLITWDWILLRPFLMERRTNSLKIMGLEMGIIGVTLSQIRMRGWELLGDTQSQYE